MCNLVPTVRLSNFTREPACTQRAAHCIPWYMLYDFHKKMTLNLNRVTKNKRQMYIVCIQKHI